MTWGKELSNLIDETKDVVPETKIVDVEDRTNYPYLYSSVKHC